jgi:hypothetical protein
MLVSVQQRQQMLLQAAQQPQQPRLQERAAELSLTECLRLEAERLKLALTPDERDVALESLGLRLGVLDPNLRVLFRNPALERTSCFSGLHCHCMTLRWHRAGEARPAEHAVLLVPRARRYYALPPLPPTDLRTLYFAVEASGMSNCVATTDIVTIAVSLLLFVCAAQ